MERTDDAARAGHRHVVYQLGRELRYHFLSLVLILFAITMWWIAASPRPPEAPDTLVAEAETATQAAQFVLLILLGPAPLVAWLWFSRRFVRRISWHADSQQVEFDLFRPIGRATLRVLPGEVGTVAHHEGVTDFTDAPSVRAPYTRLRAGGRSLILDQQGRTLDRAALNSLLAGRAPKLRREKPDTSE